MDIRDHIDMKLNDFTEKQERRDAEIRVKQERRDEKIFDKIDSIVEHDHEQDLKIAENKAAIDKVDIKVDDDIVDLEDTKDYWKGKFHFRWQTLLQILGWVFGSGGAVAGVILLVRSLKGG